MALTAAAAVFAGSPFFIGSAFGVGAPFAVRRRGGVPFAPVLAGTTFLSGAPVIA